MNKKFLIRLAPLLAIAAFAVVPAAAQGASSYKSGVQIPVGEQVPTLAWGSLTLEPSPKAAPPTTCENVVGAQTTNEELETGVITGAGATLNFATYNCVNTACLPGKVKVGAGEFEKEFSVIGTKFPWYNKLIEEGGIRSESTGVQVSLGCVAHQLSNTSPAPGGTKIGSPSSGGESGAQEQFYLAAPTVCITDPANGFKQKPLTKPGKNTTVTAALEFDGTVAGSGALSCAGGAVKGLTIGKLKVVAYKEQEVLNAKTP